MSPVTWIAPDRTKHAADRVADDGSWNCVCGHREGQTKDVVTALRDHLRKVGAA